MDAWVFVDYLCSSQMVLTHIIGGGLAYNLIRINGDRPRTLLRPVLLVEVLAFIFWCAIPAGFSTIFTLAVVLYWYEYAVGPKVTIQENAFFVAGKLIRAFLYQRVLSVAEIIRLLKNSA